MKAHMPNGGEWMAPLTVRFKKDRKFDLYQVMNGNKALAQVTCRHCPIEQSKTIARLMSTLLTTESYSIPQVLAVRDELLQGKEVSIDGVQGKESLTLQSLHENLEAADAEELEAKDPRDID